MPHIHANGIDQHYLERPATTGGGRDVVLLHGLAVTSRVWEPMLHLLPARHRAIALDARNHGGSSRTATSTVEENAADVLGAIDALGLARPVVVGNSAGAIYALEAALARPDLVGVVVSIATAGHFVAVDAAFREAALAMATGYREDLVATVRQLAPGWLGRLGSAATVAWLADQAATSDPRCGDIVASLLTYDPRSRLADLGTPAHFVHGRHDGVPVEVSAELAALCPNGSLQVLDWSGHMPHIESPGVVAAIIDEVCAVADPVVTAAPA